MGKPRSAVIALLALLLALSTACTAPAPTGSPAPVASTAPTVASTGTAHPSGPALDVRAMSWNVLGGPVPEDWFPLIPRTELEPMRRAPATVAKVRLADPDVAGFQEFQNGSDSAAWIEQQLVDYTWVHGPDNHAIIVRTSRFAVVDQGNRRLNVAGEQGAILDRYVDWVRVQDRASGRTMLVLDLHAHAWQSSALAAVRALAITRLVDLLAELDPELAEPLVLLGDFNAKSTETRPVYRAHLVKLAAAGLVDAQHAARKDTSDVPGAASLNQMSATVDGTPTAKAVKRTGVHIDYVWAPAAGVTVRTWAVLSGPGVEWSRTTRGRVAMWTGIIPSDHSPVVADLRFRRR
ncbi:MAG: endonuclease/exonuclease/phosphatase family protein [Propionicimonas sp.]|uniref:endonuclease/exonuclease/phosphatase family protein n=1 Tax=Propionicimonas sp. TaxID=1955623 RepID=UPI003D0ED8C2